MARLPPEGWLRAAGAGIPRGVTLRLPSLPLSALVGIALLTPAVASAADVPSPLAAPTSPAPVAATPARAATPPTAATHTSTSTPSSTPPATVPPAGPTPGERAAARRAAERARMQGIAAARAQRHRLQLLAAAQTHSEAVLRAERTEARRANAVELLAGSVTGSIGAAPAERLAAAAPAVPLTSASGIGSLPLPALVLGACAALLGIGAVFASRRGLGVATASLSLVVLLLAAI